VVHHFDQVRVEVLTTRVLRALQDVAQVVEVLDLLRRIAAYNGRLLL
jgi:predicted CoA-binding protein